ncbi:MAG: SH3 domain-containing protein [Muribaculaceae bacterium]|nr:SH3 domain-containing protein [Muribaculaceae bacterium]
MSLPAGFDPRTGTFDFSSNVFAPKHNYTTQPAYSDSNSESGERETMTYEELKQYNRELKRIAALSMGQRPGGIMVRFGNWLDDHIKLFCQIFYYILVTIAVIGCGIYIFEAENFFYGILRTLGAIFMLGLQVGIAALSAFIFGLFLKGIRYCLWNVTTFLISLVVLGGLITWLCVAKPWHTSTKATTEQTINNTTKYRVTANELNVRSTPSKDGHIVGKLKKGAEIKVIDFSHGFAHIMYRPYPAAVEIHAYVSADYIEQVEN